MSHSQHKHEELLPINKITIKNQKAPQASVVVSNHSPMAASSSLSNFLSFILPSKPPPQPKTPPSQLPISSPNRSQTHEHRDGFSRLVAEEGHSSSSSLSSVICPSLAYANTLFFKSAYNVQVIVDDNEPEERLLNRFRREVMRAGVIQECKRRRYFENKQDEQKRRTRDAAKRNRRR